MVLVFALFRFAETVVSRNSCTRIIVFMPNELSFIHRCSLSCVLPTLHVSSYWHSQTSQRYIHLLTLWSGSVKGPGAVFHTCSLSYLPQPGGDSPHSSRTCYVSGHETCDWALYISCSKSHLLAGGGGGKFPNKRNALGSSFLPRHAHFEIFPHPPPPIALQGSWFTHPENDSQQCEHHKQD